MSTIVVQLKLTPTPEQAAVLSSTLRALNKHADHVAAIAHREGVLTNHGLRKLTYLDLRQAGVGSQAAQHLIKKVADAYTARQANLRAGNYGRQGSRRRYRVESMPVQFRPQSAQPYDTRNLSFALDARTVSLWTFQGRLKDISFACSPDQVKTLAEHKRGESDLLCRDGSWFLLVTITVPDAAEYEPNGFVGVDLGILNIAATSDGRSRALPASSVVRGREVD